MVSATLLGVHSQAWFHEFLHKNNSPTYLHCPYQAKLSKQLLTKEIHLFSKVTTYIHFFIEIGEKDMNSNSHKN